MTREGQMLVASSSAKGALIPLVALLALAAMSGESTGSDDSGKPNRPIATDLRLVAHLNVPFRIEFNSYEGDESQPSTLEFQINTLEVHQPTQIVKIGDTIAGTDFKVVKFEKKIVFDGEEADHSKLTLQRAGGGESLVLTLEDIGNSPISCAVFRNLSNKAQFQVKKGEEFVIMPDKSSRYKLIDVNDTVALIQSPSGQKIKVPRLSP